MAKYLMALDQGTTSSRCILFDRQGRVCSQAQKELTQYFPHPGWVEHDPMEIWASQVGMAQEAMLKIGATAADIAAIGITNQRETTVVWDKATGQPVYNAIVWQCRRTAPFCDQLAAEGWGEKIRTKCGLVLDAYFSGTKIRWILDHVPGAREKAEAGELLFGTVDSWLIWNLTRGMVHVTDCSNASRTMLYNIFERRWDPELLDRLGVGAENFNSQLALIPDEVSRQNYVLGLLASEGLAQTYQGWRQNNEALIESRAASYEFQQSMAELAETVQPFLTDIVELGAQILDFFNSLPPSVQTAIGVFLLLVAVISPIAGIISTVAVAAGAAGVAMSSWLPIILAVTAALVALAAIIGLVTSGGDKSGGGGRGGGFTDGSDRSRAEFYDVPGFASGGVIPPNNPFLAVLGDNRREPEVVAPYSAIKQATSDAIAERGGASSHLTLIVKAADGFTRNLSISLDEESRRRGVKLVNDRR